MLEKAQSRQQRAAFDFESHYENLCYLSDIAPLRSVKASVAEGSVDINGDLLRSHDWPPLLDALKTNKSLSSIAIRSSARPDAGADGKENDLPPSYGADRLPPLRTRDVTYRLSLSLKDCLSVSPALTSLALPGVPLRERDLILLAKGLRDNAALVTLSLEGCQIGDKGAEVICDNVRKLRTLKTINLASCGLSAGGAEALSSLIRHQSIRRHDDAWKDSLRYRRPELDGMTGIRRITLNGNGLIGDEGVRILAETLKDDLWIKALDMQRCGVTTKGASVVLDVMKYNTSIVVLDLRRNPAVDNNVLRNVMEHVLINANGKEQEFQWLSTASPTDAAAAAAAGSKTGRSGGKSESRSKHRVGNGVDKRPSSSTKVPTSRQNDAPLPPPVEYGVPHYTAERAFRHGCASRSHPHQQQPHNHLHHQQQPGHSHRSHPLSYPREEVVGISVNGEEDYYQNHAGTPPPPPEFGAVGGAAASTRAVQFAGNHSVASSDTSHDKMSSSAAAIPPSKPPRVGWTGDASSEPAGTTAAAVAAVDDAGVKNTALEMKKLRVDFEQCWRHLQVRKELL